TMINGIAVLVTDVPTTAACRKGTKKAALKAAADPARTVTVTIVKADPDVIPGPAVGLLPCMTTIETALAADVPAPVRRSETSMAASKAMKTTMTATAGAAAAVDPVRMTMTMTATAGAAAVRRAAAGDLPQWMKRNSGKSLLEAAALAPDPRIGTSTDAS